MVAEVNVRVHCGKLLFINHFTTLVIDHLLIIGIFFAFAVVTGTSKTSIFILRLLCSFIHDVLGFAVLLIKLDGYLLSCLLHDVEGIRIDFEVALVLILFHHGQGCCAATSELSALAFCNGRLTLAD